LVDCLKCLHDFGSRCGCTGQIFELKNFEIWSVVQRFPEDCDIPQKNNPFPLILTPKKK
jgi:hypothetical protein